jgi:hypothetical protein
MIPQQVVQRAACAHRHPLQPGRGGFEIRPYKNILVVGEEPGMRRSRSEAGARKRTLRHPIQLSRAGSPDARLRKEPFLVGATLVAST